MASLHDAFAALVVHAASADVNVERQFVAFPNFYFPVDAADFGSTTWMPPMPSR